MPWLIGLMAIAAGCLNTVQAGANTTLNKVLQQPIFSALIVSGANVVAYLIAAIFLGLAYPGNARLAQVPWWAWTGGLLGAVYVLAMIFLAEKLGAALFTGLTVTAAILTSVALDHFGLLGFKEHAASLPRIIGCLFMIGGLFMVSVF